MNCTLKEATVKKYHYETHQNLRDHLQTFLMAYNLNYVEQPSTIYRDFGVNPVNLTRPYWP